MKMTWKKKKKGEGNKRLAVTNLPFETQIDDIKDSNFHTQPNSIIPNSNNTPQPQIKTLDVNDLQPSDETHLAHSFLQQGNLLAEDGKYREALGKWEAAITLTPKRAVLHEQKAQVLLEIGDSWGALKAATRAAELDPSWAEAWTTLGRAQLNFGEPDTAIESFDKALAIKPELPEAREDRQTASQLVKKRKQLHTSGISINESRYMVGDGAGNDLHGST